MPNGRFFDNFADSVLKGWLWREVGQFPVNYEIGALIALPTDGTGTSLVEVTAASYSRQTYGSGPSNWDSIGGGSRTIVSSTEVLWPEAEEYWGVMVGYVLRDAANTTRLIAYGTTPPVSIAEGARARILAGGMVINLPW